MIRAECLATWSADDVFESVSLGLSIAEGMAVGPLRTTIRPSTDRGRPPVMSDARHSDKMADSRICILPCHVPHNNLQ